MIEFRLLGAVEVVRDGRPLALGGPKQRAVLAIRLLGADRVVPLHRIIDGVWGERAGPNTANTVQVYVSNLRRALGPDRGLLVTRDTGYTVTLDGHELDVLRFLAASTEGRRLLEGNRYTEAADRLRAALGRWRGPALGDLAAEPFAAPEIAALEESRLATVEARIEADLALGRAAETVGELRTLVAAHQLRERFAALLMEALYRTGRRADALEVHRAARAVLLEELGADPGPDLRRLEREILAEAELSGVQRFERPFLVLTDGAGSREVVALHAGRSPFTIGRHPGNDLALGWDREVSRTHAHLEHTARGWALVDEGRSRNGSFVNGVRVSGRHELRDREVVRLGRTVLLYRCTTQMPAAPRPLDVTVTADVNRPFSAS
ncbi:BTAD domain-containing putative transcriptional regulator [Pseudonocardia nigra]|uniref:BTAD domain-containing putative transcriptional regulator n=1 Tax=Pseudonocardia nigra TaxID=1921578 RepID=UPI001C5E0268|nr:BTAD domain-containing putative transcriptional regulator [Pseudonocardia nigra]